MSKEPTDNAVAPERQVQGQIFVSRDYATNPEHSTRLLGDDVEYVRADAANDVSMALAELRETKASWRELRFTEEANLNTEFFDWLIEGKLPK